MNRVANSGAVLAALVRESATIELTRENVAGWLDELLAEIRRLDGLLNSPEILDFLEAVKREAAHQVARHGAAHDRDKTPDDWLWLIAYLVTKAAQAHRYGDRDRYLHHIVTAAAALGNWHRYALEQLQGART